VVVESYQAKVAEATLAEELVAVALDITVTMVKSTMAE
jgi:hypothetical protein